MRNFLFTFLLLPAAIASSAQSKDAWTVFFNRDTTLAGFKDRHGVVKIEPMFETFNMANSFDDIIAVMEAIDSTRQSYYLTKSGRIVGRDSLYFFDNGTDCENEGYIRFREPTTNKVGMFNGNGDIAIPADYNYLSKMRNGMIVAKTGARWDISQRSEILQFPWIGGKFELLDTANKVIIDSFNDYDNNINFYSLLLSAKPSADPVRQNFKGTNGLYYSFIHFDREFKDWLQSFLLNNFTKEKLLKAAYDTITYWKEDAAWISEAKTDFFRKNIDLVKNKLLQLSSKDCDYFINDDPLSLSIFLSYENKKYFSNCGEPKDSRYPVKEIIINHKRHKDLLQDHFEFLRTDGGYKLISVTINEGRLR